MSRSDFMNGSTMGLSGRMRQAQDSYHRSIETAHPKLSDTIAFQAATQRQIFDALREEATSNVSPTIDLAKQGLYNPGDMTLFHPANIGLARYIVDEFHSTDIQTSSSGYQVSRRFHEALLAVIINQPSKAWFQ